MYIGWVDTLRWAAALAAALAALCGLLLWRSHRKQVRDSRRPVPRAARREIEPSSESAEIAFQLPQMISQSARAFAEHAEGKGLHFTTAVASGLPETVRANRAGIGLVLQSLLDNAVKFTDEGAVRLEVAPDTDHAGRPGVRFIVYDTGAGIDAEMLKQILESEAPADADSRRGLAVARRLVARMGGRLIAESEPRGGSTFSFLIPVTVVEPMRATAPQPAFRSVRPLLLRAAHPERRILIADSDLAAQVAILWGVRTLGYYGEAISCRAAALEAWQRKPFDLVLFDCEMPDAAETVQCIRRFETGCIPIVAMNHADDASSISIDDQLAKPICLLALSRILDHWLGDEAPAVPSEASSDRLSLPV